MAEEREFGVAADFDFPLIIFGSTENDFSTSPSFVAGDVMLSKDGSTFVNINSSTTSQIGINSGIFALNLDSTEMQMARGVVKIVDQTATKVWEDQAILIATHGDTAALYAFNRSSSSPNVAAAIVNAGAITSTSFAAGAINSTAIASEALPASKFPVDALSTGVLSTGVITKISETVWAQSTRNLTALGFTLAASDLAAGVIGSTQIATGAFLAEKFGTGFLTSTGIAAGAINSTAIATDALTADKLAAGTITTGNVDAGFFSQIAADVNIEVLDVFTVDTFGEPITTTSAPPVTETLANKLGFPYATYRNRFESSTSTKTYFTSTGGAAFTKTISDTGLYVELAVST